MSNWHIRDSHVPIVTSSLCVDWKRQTSLLVDLFFSCMYHQLLCASLPVSLLHGRPAWFHQLRLQDRCGRGSGQSGQVHGAAPSDRSTVSQNHRQRVGLFSGTLFHLSDHQQQCHASGRGLNLGQSGTVSASLSSLISKVNIWAILKGGWDWGQTGKHWLKEGKVIPLQCCHREGKAIPLLPCPREGKLIPLLHFPREGKLIPLLHCPREVGKGRSFRSYLVPGKEMWAEDRHSLSLIFLFFLFFVLMITYIALFSALLSRLTALACGSTWVTSFL